MDGMKIAIVGYGNIGKYAIDAVQNSDDMVLAGVVRREVKGERPVELTGISVVDDIEKLGHVDVALLCLPTRSTKEKAIELLKKGIHTVDSYDIHSTIYDLKSELDEVCKSYDAVSIISAGWDPGSDSVVRALLEACAPKGITYTDFGPGMSMGHTVCVKGIQGVENALSMTIPLGTGIHRRMVYVQLKDGADYKKVCEDIKSDPYFVKDETHVIAVEDVEALIDKGHGVHLTRKGVSGKTDNQLFEFNMKVNNPALTSQVMVACARACMRQKPGAYTMIEIPMIDLLPGDAESVIRRLV